MYATILPFTTTPPDAVVEEIRLRQIAGPRDVVVRLHDGEPGPGGWTVELDSLVGPPGGKAAVAAVITFSGPLSAAVKTAVDRADRDRIGPFFAERATDTQRVLRLWQPEERRQLVVVTAVDQPSLEAGFHGISSMELLPGEDPALLPEPDHVEIFEVTA